MEGWLKIRRVSVRNGCTGKQRERVAATAPRSSSQTFTTDGTYMCLAECADDGLRLQ